MYLVFQVFLHTENFLGAYVPVTREGKIIVDGVLASCYSDFHHDLAHWIMTPMESLPAVVTWIFGEDTGYQVYVSTWSQLGLMLLPDERYWK